MEQTHTKKWFKLFPDLRFLLSKEDKEVLGKLDPTDYIDYNITSEAEVIKIVNRHKCYGWVWMRRFPNLKNLSTEEQVILDHIYPGDFISNLTEADIRRIVAYRKSNKEKAEDEERVSEARKYYKEHETEIRKEIKTRDFLTYASKFAIIGGSALATAGIIISSAPCIIGGVLTAVIPNLLSIKKLKNLNSHTVLPKQDTDPDPLPTKQKRMTIAMVIAYFVWLIGISALAGAFITGLLTDWDQGTFSITITGSAAILGLIVFLILAIVTPSKE